MKPDKLQHLTQEQHESLALLLNQACDNLKAASHIVQRASFSDDVLRASKRVQETLIDPLFVAWDTSFYPVKSPYQSVYYSVKRFRDPHP